MAGEPMAAIHWHGLCTYWRRRIKQLLRRLFSNVAQTKVNHGCGKRTWNQGELK
jgi:hypothetical protein